MTGQWAAPDEPARTWAPGSGGSGGRSRTSSAALALAAVSAGVAVAAWVLFVFGVATLLLGLVFVPLSGVLAGAGLALAAASALLLAVSAARGGRGALVAPVALLAFATVANGWLAYSVNVAPGRAHARDQQAAATAERLLPADASPVEVVDFAYRLDRLAEQDVQAPRRALCGLVVPRYRDGCHRSAAFAPPDARPAYEIVRDEGDRLVVTWTTEPFKDRAAVRLQRSERGWELVDIPDDRLDDCVVRALSTGYEAWSCPPQG